MNHKENKLAPLQKNISHKDSFVHCLQHLVFLLTTSSLFTSPAHKGNGKPFPLCAFCGSFDKYCNTVTYVTHEFFEVPVDAALEIPGERLREEEFSGDFLHIQEEFL